MEFNKKVNFLKGVLQVDKLETSSQKLIATELLSPVSSPMQIPLTQDKTREIYLQSKAKYSNEIRNELLGIDTTRERKAGTKITTTPNSLTSDDVDAVLKHHHNVQEKVAEEMLSLTRNLKENMMMANHIIKKDTQVYHSYCSISLNLMLVSRTIFRLGKQEF